MSLSLSTAAASRPQERFAAVALYRISDDKQDSLPTQRAWAQRVTQRDGLTLVGEFEDEGISGADVNRPGLEKLVAFVKERFFDRDPILSLVVIDLDRFSRRDSLSTSAWLDQLRKHGLRYIVTTAQRFDLHNPLDRTLIALGSDFTREPELRAKSNHVLNGMAERARRGLWMGGQAPLGYRIGPDGHLILGPEDEVELVRWIFQTYASGRLTANGIAWELNKRRLASRASRWNRNTVLKLMASRTYLGAIVWGSQLAGRYHRLQGGMVVPREDKQDREQHQLLRGLKHLPVKLAGEADCIFCPDAHPAIIDQETWDLCQRRREENRTNHSAPRKGARERVWPLAGQMKCGHCGEPVWTIPIGDSRGRRKGDDVDRARVACSRRRKAGSEGCPHSATSPYREALNRAIGLLQEQLADPEAVQEMRRELERQLTEQARFTQGDRRRLETRLRDLDGKIAEATANLLHVPADLRADAVEYVRGLKTQRDAAGKELRDCEARNKEASGMDPGEFESTLAMVQQLSAAMDGPETAEALRAALRELVKEVRLFWRPRQASDPRPPRGIAPPRVLGRIEMDLTPCFADLLTTGTRNSRSPRTW